MIFATVAGNLGKDSEIRQAGSSPVCSFSIASETKVKGEKRTQWINCSLFGKRGEALSQYLTKGSRVTAAGTLTQREHNGKTYLELNVSEVVLMGGGKRDGESGGGSGGKQSGGGSSGYDDQDYGGAGGGSDDIPF